MSEKIYGIDMGTNSIKIYQKAAGVILHQKNMIAMVKKKEPLALGDEAYSMYEKAPKNIEVKQPIINGGYDAQVIMAAGAFVSGSSIELSADGPMKEPYAVYFQGGLTWEHAKYGIMMSLQKIYETGKLKNILINDTES